MFTIKMKHIKSTKNTQVFENPDPVDPKITTLYINKQAFGINPVPKEIVVNVQAV